MNTDNWQERRKKAAWRRRRIIFNNDGGDAIGQAVDLVGGMVTGVGGGISDAALGTPEWFWAQRCYGLEESQVDTVFYCTSGPFNCQYHDSRVAELYTNTDGVWDVINCTQTLIDNGRDCIQLMIDFCRERNIEIFWSIRMNDTHDVWYPCRVPEYKKQHPELLIFQPEDIDKSRLPFMEPHMNVTAVNYACQEIRNRQLAIIADVCERYDIDGFEMDFMRAPVFFRPTIEGKPVKPEHLEMMTEFMSRIRDMAERIGKRRGRPILIAARLPSRARICGEIGIDIQNWLAEDLVDIVIPSLEWEPFTGPAGELTQLGHCHHVPVYAGLSQTFTTHWEGVDPLEGWIGAATNAWNAGVDGIHTFNLFNAHSNVLRTIGEPDGLEKMDKVYAVDNIAGRVRTREHVFPPEGRLPLKLSLGSSCSVSLPVGDDVATQALEGIIQELSVRIYIEDFTCDDEIELILNGQVLNTEIVYTTEGMYYLGCSTFLLRAKPKPSHIKKGDNVFGAFLKKRSKSVPGWPVITGLQLLVRYKR